MYQNIHWDLYRQKIHLWDDKTGYKVFNYKKYAYVRDSYGNFVSLYGDKLKKIYKWDDKYSDLFVCKNCSILESLISTSIKCPP